MLSQLSPVKTDATLFANNSQHCWMSFYSLNIAPFNIKMVKRVIRYFVYRPCYILLRVVGSCCAKFKTGQTFEPTTPEHFFCSVIAKAITNGSVHLRSSSNFVGTTHARYTFSIKSYQEGCILPTMHCKSQHCWELMLLLPYAFAHHCQHERSNFQHCWEWLRLFSKKQLLGR